MKVTARTGQPARGTSAQPGGRELDRRDIAAGGVDMALHVVVQLLRVYVAAQGAQLSGANIGTKHRQQRGSVGDQQALRRSMTTRLAYQSPGDGGRSAGCSARAPSSPHSLVVHRRIKIAAANMTLRLRIRPRGNQPKQRVAPC